VFCGFVLVFVHSESSELFPKRGLIPYPDFFAKSPFRRRSPLSFLGLLHAPPLLSAFSFLLPSFPGLLDHSSLPRFGHRPPVMRGAHPKCPLKPVRFHWVDGRRYSSVFGSLASPAASGLCGPILIFRCIRPGPIFYLFFHWRTSEGCTQTVLLDRRRSMFGWSAADVVVALCGWLLVAPGVEPLRLHGFFQTFPDSSFTSPFLTTFFLPGSSPDVLVAVTWNSFLPPFVRLTPSAVSREASLNGHPCAGSACVSLPPIGTFEIACARGRGVLDSCVPNRYLTSPPIVPGTD